MRLALLLLAGSVLASPAFALDACQSSPDDDQVKVCEYRPNQRYAIAAEVGFNVNLQFSPDELVKRPSFAFTARDEKGKPATSWKSAGATEGKVEAGRYKNNLPIYAFAPGSSQLIVVTTRPDGSERTYYFSLTGYKPMPADDPDVSPEKRLADERARGIVSAMSFTYPDDVKQAAAEKKAEQVRVWRDQQAKKKDDVAVNRLAVDVFYGKQNKDYEWKGDKEKYGYLLPSSITDNGWLTQMQWPGNVTVPAVAAVNPVTGELTALTPISIRNGIHVFGTTARKFRLWSGKDAVMDMVNKGWTAERPDPRTGTPSADVVRDVKYQAEK